MADLAAHLYLAVTDADRAVELQRWRDWLDSLPLP